MTINEAPVCLVCGGARTVDGRYVYTIGDEEYNNPAVPCRSCGGSGIAREGLGHCPLDALSYRARVSEFLRLYDEARLHFFIGDLHCLAEYADTDAEIHEWLRLSTRRHGVAAYRTTFRQGHRVLARLLALMESIVDDLAALEVSPPREREQVPARRRLTD